MNQRARIVTESGAPGIRHTSSSSGDFATDASIEFRHVGKSMKQGNQIVPVLRDLSGVIPHGCVVTLVGPSGSGKSTLLSLCNLLITPDEGEVYVHGREVREWSIPGLRQTVGLVFQSPAMFPGTVMDNLQYGPQLRGETLGNPKRVLQSVGLAEDMLARDAGELSGGQKQRIALARTLVNNPEVLLLDEVTSALDPSAARDVEEWILKVHEERGTTLLWVTHSLEQARRVGDWTWLLVDGQMAEVAPTEEFFETPKSDVTARFLAGELGGGAS